MKNNLVFDRLAIAATIFWVVSLAPLNSWAVDSHDPVAFERGMIQGTGAGGVARLGDQSVFVYCASARFGLGAGFEVSTPLAMSARVIDGGDRGGLVLGVGVPDAALGGGGRLLYAPMAALLGKVRIGPESALYAALDLAGAEIGIRRGRHPLWLRGSLALVIDFGRAATVGFGLAHQRLVADGEHPQGLDRVGWAGDSRVSFGAVRALPFSDVPTLSVHLQRYLDLIVMVRFDVDLDERSSTARTLIGFELKN